MADDDLKRPSLRFPMPNGDDIKMTYGLEMDLRRLLPDAASVLQLVMSDPYTQDYIIRRCLTNSGKMIQSNDDLITAEEITLNSDETEALLMWVTEHVLYFFVTRAKSIQTLGARYGKAMPNAVKMTPTPDGSETSASTTPSAGPTE